MGRTIIYKESSSSLSRPGDIAERNVPALPHGLREEGHLYRIVHAVFGDENVVEATLRYSDGSFVTWQALESA